LNKPVIFANVRVKQNSETMQQCKSLECHNNVN